MVEIDRGLALLIKLVVRSVARDVESWLALILATAVLAAIMTLVIGLIVVGSHGSSDDQQAFSVFGGVAICFSALVGLISLMMVIRVCLGLQRRSVALWQLTGVLPRTAFIALIAEVLLVSALSAALGALAAWALWFPFTRMVLSSGLPPSDALDGTMPTAALWIGTMATAAVCVLGGVMASRRLTRQDVLTALHAGEGSGSRTRTLVRRIIRIVWIVALLDGIATLYWAISRVPPLSPGEATANFLTTYVGMGMLLCFALSQCAIPLVRGLLGILGIGARRANTSWFLAVNEASANIALTRSLVVPIALAGAAAGVVMTWLGKLVVVLGGSGGHVSAPLAQLLLLFGGGFGGVRHLGHTKQGFGGAARQRRHPRHAASEGML
ncbi:MAG: FtsX-like permease family protein [Bifidobacterium tibiigranuli]|uniref:FtsX-like permease family protein n=1 Tax=Bifidobacterium tibiigranuli TaxID=2172043 RepID=UPI0026EBA556|nr:FtsX-like permease family protein [Bifidobacterium tibiigranuli]MCI1673509.1 FtsX-like permease family protein [Bifidobacterium tibiigranuli]MCI1712809.1 FtsX-like permease family protein [Bifidobacterium tibiigranuli]MCI1833488.1 FtsX-like permease family protein [Bifidobacterium tibiigranuli]